MPIVEFDHYTVRSKDTAASWAFYERGLGLNVRERPGFSVPAFIVSIGNREVVHVFQASAEMEAIFARLPSSDQVEGSSISTSRCRRSSWPRLVPIENTQRTQRVPPAGLTIAVFKREMDFAAIGVFQQPRPVGLALGAE